MIDIDLTYLSEHERSEVERLLSLCPNNRMHVEDIWRLMDSVWDDLGCNRRKPDRDCLRRFYQHPVWVLNGLFIEQHPRSMQHRKAVSDWVAKHDVRQVLDYGGGFGTLARLIAEDRGIRVAVYEPYPSEAALVRADPYPNLQFVSSLSSAKYDCAIAIDVLEHVMEPLEILGDMIDATRVNGYVIIDSHFRPSTKCHLPTTFHLRYTFDLFARQMGLRVLGRCEGGYAKIYQKDSLPARNHRWLETLQSISRAAFPVLSALHPVYSRARQLWQ